MTRDELRSLKGGELMVRYIELVHRYGKMPDAQWLRRSLDETGDELYLRMQLGSLSEGLCGIFRHFTDGAYKIRQCDCEN